MVTQAQQFLNNSVIMVALIVYAILGLLLNGAVRLLQRNEFNDTVSGSS